jgi:transposase
MILVTGASGNVGSEAARLLGAQHHITSKASAAPKSGFSVIPHRWVIERTNAWIMKARRNRADYERLPAHAEAMINLALIRVMARRLARAAGPEILADLQAPWV